MGICAQSKEAMKGPLNPIKIIKALLYKRKFREGHPEYFDPCGTLIFTGAQGYGKTLSAVHYVTELAWLYPRSILVTNVDIRSDMFPEGYDIREYHGLDDLKNVENGYAGVIFFIDEIHRLSPVVEEYLYSAMEDYRIDIMIDKGPSARSIQIDLNPFTLVGATTRSGLLTAPLRARFGINLHLEYYDDDILSSIIRRSASILDVPCSIRAAAEIASRSRGTPRIANALLRRVRDFAQVKGSGSIDTEIAQFALEALNIDKYGLDEIDNKILCTIIDKFKGGPVGLTTIATALGEDAGTIEEVYEPFLIKEGFMKRTPRGREVTELAYKHLGRSLYSGNQKTLFGD